MIIDNGDLLSDKVVEKRTEECDVVAVLYSSKMRDIISTYRAATNYVGFKVIHIHRYKTQTALLLKYGPSYNSEIAKNFIQTLSLRKPQGGIQ